MSYFQQLNIFSITLSYQNQNVKKLTPKSIKFSNTKQTSHQQHLIALSTWTSVINSSIFGTDKSSYMVTIGQQDLTITTYVVSHITYIYNNYKMNIGHIHQSLK